jgi:hypothetical protein
VLINPIMPYTSTETVTIPASAWGTDGKATVSVSGMKSGMTQGDFEVKGATAAQIPVEAAAGLGNTDIIPGDGTITITATGMIPTTELKAIVIIYERKD